MGGVQGTTEMVAPGSRGRAHVRFHDMTVDVMTKKEVCVPRPRNVMSVHSSSGRAISPVPPRRAENERSRLRDVQATVCVDAQGLVQHKLTERRVRVETASRVQ